MDFFLSYEKFKDMLIQFGLPKALEENIFNIDIKQSNEIDLIVSSTIRMYLVKNIFANIFSVSSAK